MKKRVLLLTMLALWLTAVYAQDVVATDAAEDVVVAQPQPLLQDSAPLSYTLTIRSDKSYSVSAEPETRVRQTVQQAFPRHYLMVSVGDAYFAQEMNMGLYYCAMPYISPHYGWFDDDTYTSRSVHLPNFGLSYYYSFRPWFLLGAEVGYNYYGYDRNYVSDGEHYRTDGNHFLSVMLATRFQYINRKYFGLYQSLALGVALDFGTTDGALQYVDPFPAFQVNLLGMRFGNKVYGALELGVGSKGFVNVGIGTRF